MMLKWATLIVLVSSNLGANVPVQSVKPFSNFPTHLHYSYLQGFEELRKCAADNDLQSTKIISGKQKNVIPIEQNSNLVNLELDKLVFYYSYAL